MIFLRKKIISNLTKIIILLQLSNIAKSIFIPSHTLPTSSDHQLEPRDSCGNYICYYGSSASYPGPSQWITYDKMFQLNRNNIRNSCRNLGLGPDNVSDAQIDMIYRAIAAEGSHSDVDPRWILAIMMEESVGCPGVGATANPVVGLPSNPGLMQSAGGTSFVGNRASAKQQEASIRQMIADGVRGTARGWGLVQWLGLRNGNFYEAARMYNSGYSGNFANLNSGGVATAAYVCDLANRLTGPYVDSHFSRC